MKISTKTTTTSCLFCAQTKTSFSETSTKEYTKRGFNHFLKTALLTLVIFAAGIGSFLGQVELIPTSDGGFENATSAFLNNGWASVGTSTRTWRVGTFGGAATGTKAAYWGTTTAFGGSAASAVGHFYRDIAIPAGATNVFLNYKLKYPTVDNTYDYFYVFTTTTSNTPVNGTIPSTGYTNRFTNTASAYTSFTAMPQVNLTALAGTTVRLVFTFKTDAWTPNSAAAVDDISLTYISASACTGTPNTPSISGATSACSGVNFSLNSAGTSAGTGITYQWQHSTDAGASWADVSGATATSLTTNATVNKQFRLVTTCSGSGSSSTSAAYAVNITAFVACTCGAYSVVTASSSFDTEISSVTVGSMTNASNTCTAAAPGSGSIAGTYANFAGIIAGPTATQGNSVPLTVVQGSCSGTNYGNIIQIYVDWNQNGAFSNAERVYESTSGNNTAPGVSGSFTVPTTALVGTTRMRIVVVEAGTAGINYTNTAWSTFASYGETEDYCFTVNAPVPPTISSVPASACPGSTVTISGSDFMSITAVTFGGVPATSFTVVNSTTIQAVLSAPGAVVVTNAYGSATSSGNITFSESALAAPVTNVSSVSAQFGQAVTIFVVAPSSSVVYNWYTSANPTFAFATDTIATTFACGNVYVAAVLPGGVCESPRTMVSVTISSYPQIISSEDVFCGTGGGFSLTAEPISASATTTWQSLTPSAVLSSTTANPTSTTISETSDFMLTVSAPGCQDYTVYKSIGVYPLPTAVVTTSATGVCPGTSATINSGLSAGNFTVSPIAIGMQPVPSNAVTLANNGVASIPTSSSVGVTPLDDSGWGSIPIGFTFNYFGSNFSTINVGTNLVLQFGAYNGTGNGGLGDFTYTTFPSLIEPISIIAAAAHDLQFDAAISPAINGSIKYWTQGYAPNRRFIIQYQNAREYGTNGATAKYTTTQIHLFETLGAVDIHVPSSTGTSNKVVGLQDGSKTIGAVAPGRQSFTGSITTPEAWRFAPPTNYTTIWTANGEQIASGTNIFTQTVTPEATTLYDISYTNQTTGCASEPGSAQVNMVVLTPTPVTGVTTTSTVSQVCAGSTVPLAHDYTVISSGLTYQWQSSVDGGITWTDVAGATASTFSPIQNVATSYQVGISACSGPMNYSSPLAIGMSSAQSQSCLTYCIATPTYGTSVGDLISSVSIVGTTLNNNTGFVAGTPSYTLYNTLPNHTATLDPSTNYTVNISIGEWGSQGVAAWIDYDDNGVFSTTERIGATSGMIGSGLTPGQINATGSFTISLACNPPAGLHRLRVRNVYGSNGVNIDPCTNYMYGETEDYFVTINPAPACPTSGVFAAQLNTADMSTAADFIWQQGCATSTSYDFEYGPTGFALGTGTLVSNQTVSVSGTTASYTLTGLAPSSTYDVYARVNCDAVNVSFWSNAVSVITVPVAAPVTSPQTFCQEQGATVSNLVATGALGSSINWYSSATSTEWLLSTDLLSSATYYASQVINGFESSNRAATQITIVANSSFTTPVSACDSYVWNGATYSESGTYTGTTSNCVTQLLSLTIITSSTNTSTASACDSYSWNGTTYYASGTYTGTTENCVTQFLSLSITSSSTNTSTASSCDSYSWNGTTYYASGTYTGTIENCITQSLNLTITPSSTNTTTTSAVGTYTWAENGQTYTSSGVYSGSAVNCLTQALNLTIIPYSTALSLKVFLDGYYQYGSNPASMVAARYLNLVEAGSASPGAVTDVDLITVQLRSATNTETIVHTVTPILQTNGNVQCVFPPAATGNSYYIVVDHKGSNPLWSANPITLTTSTTYNFANNLGNAYSDGDLSLSPMHTIVSGLYGIWLGELNEDGYLDAADYSNLEMDIYASGYQGLYLLDADLNGDTYVDASDFAVFDSNSNYGAYEQRPY